MSNIDLFDSFVSTRVQRALLRLTLSTCKGASEHCISNFKSASVALDSIGSWRRQMMEDQLGGMQAVFPSLEVKPKPYEGNTGHYYEVTCGDVKITQSCIVSPGDVPRQAHFRSTLASDGQIIMFDEPTETEAEETRSKHLYSILTYGIDKNSEKRSTPAFVKIQFPNKDCTAYVDEGIDLFKRFPAIVAEFIGKPQFGNGVQEKRRRKQKEA